MVVVDPRRTETAREADEHVAILPGGDAAFLLSLVHVLVAEGRVDRRGDSSAWPAAGTRSKSGLAAFAPERVAASAGIDAETIRRLAREFAERTNVGGLFARGRLQQRVRHGRLAGHRSVEPGRRSAGRRSAGSMFPTPAFDTTPIVKFTGADGHARWHSRVRGLPETLGDLPASILAEEIETPGAGQVRAMVTFAGNPVLSTPNGRRLAAALGQLGVHGRRSICTSTRPRATPTSFCRPRGACATITST